MTSTCRFVLTSVALLMVAAVSNAQQPPASQYEHVKGLEPFIGFWQGDFQPSGAPQGTITGICRWTANQSYANFSWSFQPQDGERMQVGTVIIGWNGQKKQLSAWSFFPQGVAEGKVEQNGNVLTVTTSGTTAAGEEMSSVATYELSGDALTITVKGLKRAGQELPGYSFTVNKRERRGRGGQ